MNHPSIVILADECHGINCPKVALEGLTCKHNISDEDIEIISQPDHAHYWDTWDELLNSAVLELEDGTKYTLYQDGTVYALIEGFYESDEAREFFGDY